MINSKTGSAFISLAFVLLGMLTLHDTSTYSDIDSKVFPRAAAVALILAASVSLLASLQGTESEEGFGKGSWWRRLLLITSLLAACFLMPRVGFLIASTIAFIGAMIAANHDRFSSLYLLACALVVGGFYTLFKFGLKVPLP